MTAQSIDILKDRRDFLRLRGGLFVRETGFLIQAMPNPSDPKAKRRVGFTCSKKVGNAVNRNRAKRRLREIARAILPVHGRDGWDYVFIGKRDVTAKRDFAKLCREAERALSKIHSVPKP